MDLPIYLDHAATTPVDPDVLAAMLPAFGTAYANPAALYGPGAEARALVDDAREGIAAEIGARPEEVYFTSGGTEGDNWALRGRALSAKSGHLLISAIEHKAVLEPAESLAGMGIEIELLPVDGDGLVDPVDVERAIRADTILVSVMHANNEVGTVEPIDEISAVCRRRGVPLHTDAVQTLGKLPFDVDQLGVDLATFSAHKLYGPKGVGALYIRRGTRIAPYLEGGEQERGRRAGTLNVPGIVGFAAAVRKAAAERESEAVRLLRLTDRLIEGVLKRVPGARLSGHRERRLPNNAHFRIDGVEGESLLLALDMAGVCASAGSACTAGSTEPSHVLLAMGVPFEEARGALRLTLGASTTEEAVDYVVDQLAAITRDLRSLSGAGALVG